MSDDMRTSSLFLRKFAFGRMIFWFTNAVAVTFVFFFAKGVWEQVSVFYLVLVSLYANFATDMTNWQAARVEVKTDLNEGESNINVEAPSAEVDVKGKGVSVQGE